MPPSRECKGMLMSLLRMAALVTALGLAGCAAVQVPPNMHVDARSDGAGVVRSVDFSYSTTGAPDYGRLKLCVAENVSNDAVTLRGDAQTLATPWGVLQGANTDTVAAGGVFKFSDDAHQVLIALGTTDGGSDATGIVRYAVKYQLRSDVSGQHVGMVFSHISQAQRDTGSWSNMGFSPVGTWAGGRAMAVYGALQQVADAIQGCMRA